jgi:hypothetical protein
MTFLLPLLSIGKTALQWLARLPWYILTIAALCAVCVILWTGWGKAADVLKDERATHSQTVANYRKASDDATAAAVANKARVETKYVEIENEADKSIRDRIAILTERLRKQAKANQSGSGAVGLPVASVATVDPNGAGEGAFDNDPLICVENTVKAQGWQDWYKGVAAVK